MIPEKATCTTCGKSKLATEFYRDRRHKNGLYASCRKCSCVTTRRCAAKNPEKHAARLKRWRRKNASRLAMYHRSYREQNKDRVRTWKKNWDSCHRQHMKEYAKQYQKTNRSKLNKYVRERSRNDIQYRLERRLRTRLADALSGRQRFASSVRDLGCIIPELKTYLSSLWLEGMNWDNWGRGHGKWHVDHKRPLASFDLTDPDQQKIACHYTNLQPLWKEDNLRKSGPRHPSPSRIKRTPNLPTSRRKPLIDLIAISAFCRRRDVKSLALFGSILTDNFDEKSDVDVLIDVRDRSLGFHETCEILDELESMFGRKVDLLTTAKLSPEHMSSKRRESISKTAKIIYETV
jgi:predicted nucleotidyltransferase